MGRGPAEIDVLVVTQYFPPERGAAQVRLEALCRELQRAGATVEVVTALPSYPLGRTFPGWRRRPVQADVEDGVRVVRVWTWAAMGSGVGRLLGYLSFGLMVGLGLSRARRPRWVFVEYPTPFGAVVPLLWARARGARTVLNVADLWVDVVADAGVPGGRPALAALRRLERWLLRRSDAVTVVTEGMGQAVRDRGVPADRVCWLPNGVDTELFRPGDAEPDDPPVVLYAGTHGHVHGLEVVLDAAGHLADRRVRFLLVGGGSEKEALVAEAERRELGNVEFRDPVSPEEVARLLRRARVGLASVRPGDVYRSVRSAKVFPMMASAVPVVYSGADEGASVVVRAGGGVAVPPGDGAALADAVAHLLDHPAEAAALGAAGRRWVVAHHEWGALVRAWLDQLDDPACRPGARLDPTAAEEASP